MLVSREGRIPDYILSIEERYVIDGEHTTNRTMSEDLSAIGWSSLQYSDNSCQPENTA